MIRTQILGGITITPIAKPVAAVLAFFYSLVPNFGIAIVLLTVAMMIVLTPLTIKQTRSMLVMQKLQPEMKKLQEQHKNDRQALNEAVMALYKEHNASPLGGCLPMLLPFPLFIALLRVLEGLSHVVHGVPVPKYLTPHTQMYKDIVAAHGQLDAFGMNLAKTARNVGGGFGHTLPYFVLLLIMVGTQFYQQYQLTSRNPAAKSQPGQAAMMKFIPLFFGLISLGFPAGVVLYWTVSNIIRIAQQWALYKYDPKVKALVAHDVKEIEAKTREIDARDARPKQPKAPRPGGLRGLLANAAEAAADRRSQTGKGDGRATERAGGDKGSGATRPGVRPQSGSGKAAGGTPSGPKRPAAGTPAAGKRPLTGTPSGGKPAASADRKTPPQGVPRKASASAGGKTPPQGVPGKAGAPKAGAGKPPLKPGAKPATPSAASSPTGATKPNGAGKAENGTNAASQPTVAPGNSPAQASANGGSGNQEGTDRVPPVAADAAGKGNGAPKGRTGGGSARNVSSRHRRRGR